MYIIPRNKAILKTKYRYITVLLNILTSKYSDMLRIVLFLGIIY